MCRRVCVSRLPADLSKRFLGLQLLSHLSCAQWSRGSLAHLPLAVHGHHPEGAVTRVDRPELLGHQWPEEVRIQAAGGHQSGERAGVGERLPCLAFKLLDLALGGIRVPPQEEIEGLDIGEHGGKAYPNFTVVDELPYR